MCEVCAFARLEKLIQEAKINLTRAVNVDKTDVSELNRRRLEIGAERLGYQYARLCEEKRDLLRIERAQQKYGDK